MVLPPHSSPNCMRTDAYTRRVQRLLILLMMPSLLYAQTGAPVGVISAATVVPAEKQVKFRITWRQTQAVDSTQLYVYLSNSVAPRVQRRTRPISAVSAGQGVQYTDTVSFTIPDDTTTYRFVLVNLRKGLSSAPAYINWRFDADQYYRISRVHIRPKTITLDPDSSTVFCAFIEYNDGSIVMRDKDRTIAKCQDEYMKFDGTLRKSVGARLRNANRVCLEWQATGGRIQGESCPQQSRAR